MTRSFAGTLIVMTFIALLANPKHACAAVYNWTGTGNWTTTGPWGGTVPTTGDTGNIATGTATANGTLAGSPTINVTGTGILFINALGVPLTASGTVSAGSGGTINYQGTSTDTSLITLNTGARIGRPLSNNTTIVNNALALSAGATVTAGNINASVIRSSLGIQLVGPLSSADNLATFVVNPTTAGFLGSVMLAPTSANTGFIGNVNIQAGPGGSTPGTLVLSGTGALSNVNNVTINSGSILRFRNAVDPLASGKAITVPTGGRVEWEGILGSYSYAQAARPTITFVNGSTFGKLEDQNVRSRSLENIVIGNAPNATVTASQINSSVTRTNLGLELSGTLSSFDNSATLAINPSVAGHLGALIINPVANNTGFTGNVTISAGPGGSTPGVLVLGGTGALSNVGNITIGSGAMLRFADATNPLPSAYALNVPTGARVEWEGSTSAFTGGVIAPTITLQNGSTFGREESQNVLGISNANLVIPAGATVTASRINATVTRTTLGLQLSGSLASGDNTSTLVINPTTAGFLGVLNIAPTSNNTGFTGNVNIQAGPGGATPGVLALGGTGALSNVNNLTVGSGAYLKFRNATNPLPSGYIVTIPSGGRFEWEGSTSAFTGGITPPTILLQNGSTFGREEDSNVLGVLNATLAVQSGATTTATRILGTVARTDLGLRLNGPLTGDATTKIKYDAVGGFLGPFVLNPSSANPFAGTFELNGLSAANQSSLVLQGTGPLANAKLLDINNFTTAVVFAAGAGDGIDEIRIHNGGTLRFRNNVSSTLNDSSLTGDGRVRSELVDSASTSLVLVDQALRPLTLTNTTIAPGFSAGTLSFQADGLTLGTGTTYEAELGLTPDVIAVTGNLTLTPGSTLEISNIAGFTPGTHVIATYSGTLTGTFGTLVNNLNAIYLLNGINYGTGTNSFISIDVSFAPVPEPNTGLLAGLGFIGAMVVRRKKRAQK